MWVDGPLQPSHPALTFATGHHEAVSLTWKSLSVDSGAGLGRGAGRTQHGGKGAPLLDGGDHVDRREGEDAGSGGSSREGHGGGSRQRGARGHDSGAGQGGAGAAGKAVGDTTGRQHQSEQQGWAPQGQWASCGLLSRHQAQTSLGAVRVLGIPVQGLEVGWEPLGSWANPGLLGGSGDPLLGLEMTGPGEAKTNTKPEYLRKPNTG